MQSKINSQEDGWSRNVEENYMENYMALKKTRASALLDANASDYHDANGALSNADTANYNGNSCNGYDDTFKPVTDLQVIMENKNLRND